MSDTDRLMEVLELVFASSPIEMNADTIDAMTKAIGPLATDEITVLMSGTEGFAGTYEGPNALRDAWGDWLETFSRVRLEIEDVVMVRDGVVIAYAKQIGVTHHADSEIEQPSAAVFKLEDGKLARVEFHLDRAAAERSARG